ncbi:MAG: HAMP domain-containing histidine kinase [Bacteroidales bacterium]|nr:HAMP domain-containing histidine kinase [Bacteroidales bacterium]
MSLRFKLLSGFFITLLLFSILIFTYYPVLKKEHLKHDVETKYADKAQLIAFGVAAGLNLENSNLIQEAIEIAKKDSNIVLLVAQNKSDEIFAVYNPEHIEDIKPFLEAKESVFKYDSQTYYFVKVPIIYNDFNYGNITVVGSLDGYYQMIKKSSRTSFIISVFLFLLGILISYFFIRSVTKPLIQLQKASTKIALGDYDCSIPIRSNDEIGALAKSFREMAAKVRQLISSLNQEIESSKKAEEELIKINAEKDRFFSIIAHDLRSPFNNFLGLTQIMEEELEKLSAEDLKKMTSGMKTSAAKLFALLENLLKWAKSKQGLMAIEPEFLRLNILVNETLNQFEDTIKQKNIRIENKVDDSISVFVDQNVLQTVLRNLISNALKFTPHSGKIVIDAQRKENEVEVFIQDSGIGMHAKLLSNLFRIDMQTSRKGIDGEPSSGLGLILCKEFIEKSGGKIWAESEENRGTTFFFTLPL